MMKSSDGMVVEEMQEFEMGDAMAPGVAPTMDEDKSAIGGPAEEQDFGDVEVRSNFNETAFFYPHLKTDADGNLIISFTVPQSLTKWKMMGLAHTKRSSNQVRSTMNW